MSWRAYFARSIRGAHSSVDLEGVAAAIEGCGLLMQFDLPISGLDLLTGDPYIYQRDIYQIQHCDILIAEVTDPSHGVGYEIAYAKHVQNIPILLVCLKGTQVSAMLTGGLEVIEYRDLSHLQGIIEAFCKSHEGMGI